MCTKKHAFSSSVSSIISTGCPGGDSSGRPNGPYTHAQWWEIVSRLKKATSQTRGECYQFGKPGQITPHTTVQLKSTRPSTTATIKLNQMDYSNRILYLGPHLSAKNRKLRLHWPLQSLDLESRRAYLGCALK